MIFRLFFLGLVFLVPFAVDAQDAASGGTLHVLRPVIHAEQDKAELCLEFDHALVSGDAAKITAAIKLESGLKTLPVSARSLSVTGSELCVPGLEHRHDYRLVLSSLRNAEGEKLGSPYSLSFIVPARRPALAFVNAGRDNGLVRWRENGLALRSLNASEVTFELFRVTDPAHMAEAWSQRGQTLLAPSESATFARTNGAPVWQGKLSFDDAPDKNVEQPVPFDTQAAALPAGLYILIAVAPDAKEKESDLPPMAATLLLRSNLKLEAVRNDGGFVALAEKADAPAAIGNVRVLVLDRGQQTLVEGKTDADGSATLAVEEKKRASAALLLGLTDVGDAAFLDADKDLIDGATLQNTVASITPAAPVYAPAVTADIILVARDIHDRPVTLKGDTLQLLRPDRSVYASYPVPDDRPLPAHISIPAPAMSGVWPLVWHRADGSTVADGSLRISPDMDAPRLDISADRQLLGADGEVNIVIRSLALSGAEVPYVAGRIAVTWNVPDHIFSSYDDYRFGTGVRADIPQPLVAFVTDGKGVAHLHLKLAAPADAPLHSAALAVISDPSEGVLDPALLTLPVRPRDYIVGIRPSEPRGRFPENSLARFDVIALDSEGKQRAVEDLSWQMYEEGRSFDWYQSDGRWEYKPLQQHRRVGGGTLALGAEGARRIEWPVAAGAYRLDISSGDTVLARLDFGVGWDVESAQGGDPDKLDLKPSAIRLQAGLEARVRFTTGKPGMVTAVIADDHVRKVIHLAVQANESAITFTPAADWGNRVSVNVHFESSFGDTATGQVTLPLGTAPQVADTKPVAKASKDRAVAQPEIVRIDYTMRVAQAQIIAPQRSWVAVPEKGKAKAKTDMRFLLASPEPLCNAPDLLAAALEAAPFTTAELAREIEFLQRWRNVIAAAGVAPAVSLQTQQDALFTRLLARQQADGGFPDGLGSASDIADTAAALTVIGRDATPLAKPVVDQAAEWLHHRLENTWFDEQERPERAAAYAGLAAAGKLDMSNLHYFSDTSVDKALPPRAAAELAFAFSTVNDRDKALFWINAVPKDKIDAPILALLTANNFYNVHDAADLLAKQAGDGAHSKDLETVTQLLDSIANVQDRAGEWRVFFNKDARTVRGVAAYAINEKAGMPTVRNPSDRPIYVMQVAASAGRLGGSAVTRHIYSLDGSEANGDLRRGEVYVVLLEGDWPGDSAAALLHAEPGPGLQPSGCALESPPIESFLGWLSGKSLTPVQVCEPVGNGLDILLVRPEGAGPWHAAYLALATRAGAMSLAPPQLRGFSAADFKGRKKS